MHRSVRSLALSATLFAGLLAGCHSTNSTTAGSTTVRMPDGSTQVIGYRVSAVSQQLVSGTQPAPLQQVVGQQAGCPQLSVRMTGLTSGVPYVFWLEEQTTSKIRW